MSWVPVKKPPQGSPGASTGGSGKRGAWKSLTGEGDLNLGGGLLSPGVGLPVALAVPQLRAHSFRGRRREAVQVLGRGFPAGRRRRCFAGGAGSGGGAQVPHEHLVVVVLPRRQGGQQGRLRDPEGDSAQSARGPEGRVWGPEGRVWVGSAAGAGEGLRLRVVLRDRAPRRCGSLREAVLSDRVGPRHPGRGAPRRCSLLLPALGAGRLGRPVAATSGGPGWGAGLGGGGL